MNIGQLIASLGVETSGLVAAEVAMKNFEKKANTSMASVQTTLASVGARMQNFGRSATMYLSLPIGLAGAAVLKSSKDFEIAMQHIVGLVGESQTQVNQWSKDILALSPEIARPPEELAKALYFVTSSGIKGAEALDVVKQSAKGASAGLGETMQVADLVTSAMNAYKDSGLTASRSLDVLTAAVREGKGEASAYATQMGEVIPIASKMGVGFDQVAAAMSSMTLTGSNVSETATYLRQILVSLLDPAKQSEDALRNMGTSSAELRKVIREQGLLTALTKLNDLTKIYGETAMGKVFPNVRALTGVLSLMGDRLENNREIFAKVANSSGDMNKAFQAVTNTIDFKYNQALANVKVGLIEVGMSMKSSIIPILERLGSTVRGLVSWYTNLSDTQKKLVIYTAGLLAVIGPLSITMSVLAKVAANVITNMSILIGLISKINVWIALAIGIAGVIIALNNWGKTTNEFNKFQKDLNNQMGDEVFKLTDIFDKLKKTNLSTQQRADTLKIVNERYGPYLKYLLTEKSTLVDIEAAQRKATDALIASASLKAYREKLDKEMSSISKSFDQYFSDFTTGFSKMYGGDRVGEFITGIFEGANRAIKQGNSLQVSQELYDQFVERMSKRTGYLKYSIEDFRKAFLNFVQTKGEKNQVVDQINAMITAYEKLTTTQDIVTKEQKENSSIKDLEKDIRSSKLILEQYEAQLKQGEWWRQLYAPIDELQSKIDSLDYRKLLMFASDIGTPMQQLQKQLADIALKNATFGDSLDTVGDQANYVKQTIQNLWEQGFRPGSTLMDQYISKLTQLQDVQMESTVYFDNMKNAIFEVAQAFENIESIETFANAVINAARSMIIAMITEAVVANTAKAVKGSKSWWSAILQGAAAMAATYALFAAIPKFAKGGEVPSGYPHDSYPAMLTSGEKIIPAGKPLKLENQNSSLEGNVVFRISGYELVGILEKQNKKTKVL
jgi:TP901 family phage tail tape measure protein